MRSPLPLLVVVAFIAIAAAWFAVLGLPTWVAVVLGVPAWIVFLRAMDVITAVPMRIRNRRIEQTLCPSCGKPLGERCRWQTVYPAPEVECSRCHAVSTFDSRGRLKGLASTGAGSAEPDGPRPD
jgi:hypothetical protein